MDKQKKNTKTTISSKPLYAQQTGDLQIKLTNDYFFKALLQKNTSVLRSLIRSLLRLPDNAIEDLEVTNPIILGESAEEKTIHTS